MNFPKPLVLYPLYITESGTYDIEPNTVSMIALNNGLTAIINLPQLSKVFKCFQINFRGGVAGGSLTINAYPGDFIGTTTSLILNSINGTTTCLVAKATEGKWTIIMQPVGPSTVIGTTLNPVSINPIIPTSGQLLTATSSTMAEWQIFNNPSTTTLYVDTRTDSYTQTGSILYPYKTIMGAINKIISNGDNSLSKPYCIFIIGVGVYNEDIVLENDNLVSISITAVYGVSITSITSNNNNNNLAQFELSNILFSGNIIFNNTVDNGTMAFSVFKFYNCHFYGDFTVQNANYLGFISTIFQSNISLTNIGLAFFVSSQGTVFGFTTGVNLIYDGLLPKPAGSVIPGMTFATLEHTSFAQTVNIGQNTRLDLIAGSSIGTNFAQPVSFNLSGIINSYGGYIYCPIIISSTGVFNNFNTNIGDTITINPGGSYNSSGSSLISEILLGNNLLKIISGSGDPNTVVSAPMGSIYLNIAGGANTSIWIKESGSGNTGWISK